MQQRHWSQPPYEKSSKPPSVTDYPYGLTLKIAAIIGLALTFIFYLVWLTGIPSQPVGRSLDLSVLHYIAFGAAVFWFAIFCLGQLLTYAARTARATDRLVALIRISAR